VHSLGFWLLLLCMLPRIVDAAAPPSVQRFESEALAAINEVRAEAGLSPLQPLDALRTLARAHSRHMYETQKLTHQGPEGQDVAARALDAGIRYRLVGENVAMNYNQPEPVEAAVSGWLDSPGHRANILRPDFTHTGVGIVGEGSTYYFTQIFLRPLAEAAAAVGEPID
jgi:uncharacterized protein YkwD